MTHIIGYHHILMCTKSGDETPEELGAQKSLQN